MRVVTGPIEVTITINEEVVACEQRFNRQCARVVAMTRAGQDTDELLLVAYHTSLLPIRTYRNQLLRDAI